MIKRTKLSLSLVMAFGGVFLSAGGHAQEVPNNGQQSLQRVVITGSNIRRVDAETPSPVQIITADELKRSGYTSVQDVLHNITANGQGTLSQGNSLAFASGASGIALRGLTVGSTLVLIDGHRSAPYPIGDDGQRSFVDISNIPFDAVERIEVLKDGASAIYGSDAVAGVVNIILKRQFSGATISADTGVSGHNDGALYHVSGIFGHGDLDADGHNFYISLEARKQNQIKYADRGGLLTQTDFTGTGGFDVTPGVPTDLNGGLASSATGYITDADGNIIGFLPGCDAASYADGKCTYKDNWSQIQPRTENYNLVGKYTQRLPSDWEASVQGSFFQSKAEQVTGPNRTSPDGFQGVTSGPGVVPTVLPTLPPTTLPNTNPSFPAGVGAASGILHYTFLGLGPNITATNAKTTRLIFDVNGPFAGWDIGAAAGYTEVKLDLKGFNYLQPARLQTALDSTTDPYIVGGPNSPEVLDFIAPELSAKNKSSLSFVHVGASRDLMALGGGPLSLALGADYYHRKQHAPAPQDVADGLVGSAGDTTFSNNFTIGKQNVTSGYLELVAPFTKKFEAEAAVRYDHYNLSGGKASPKLGFKFTPNRAFALRGTVARGFRAPSPAENGNAGQTFFAGTISDKELCKDPANVTTTPFNFPSQCDFEVASLQTTNKKLKPETSTSYTLGLIFEPSRDFSATIDFYHIKIKDQIVTADGEAVRGSNFTPILQVQPDLTQILVVPPVAPIVYTTATYVNANSTTVEGVDVDLLFKHRFESAGVLRSDFMISYNYKYDLRIDGVTYHLAGTHGPFIISGDTGNPKTRIQWTNTFSRGPWSLTGTINYVGSFNLLDKSYGINTCIDSLNNGSGAAYYTDVLGAGMVPQGVGCHVASFTTVDLYGRYDISNQLTLSASILNLFDRKFPADWNTYGGGTAPYNPSFHSQGAIGRYFTVGARYTF